MLFEKTEYLSLRHELRFRPDGGFRILILTDPHGGTDCHPQLKKGIDAIFQFENQVPVSEIADKTGMTYGAVRTSMTRARQYLAGCIKEQGYI